MPSGREERIAIVVVIAATAWLAVALCWGLFAPVDNGHGAVVAARAIAADNMLTWNIRGPVGAYMFTAPEPRLYDIRHPWGSYWVIAALMKVFGRHAFVPRLAPILMSVAAPPLLYGIGRALWGPTPGALSALAYVILPISLAVGNLPALEVPLVFGCLLTTWGYVHFQRRWQRRWMAVSLVGVLLSANSDWEASLFIAPVLWTLLVAGYFMPNWFGRVPARRFGQWWSFSFCIAVVTVFAYAAYIKHIGAVDAFLADDAKTDAAANTPALSQLRSYRIALSFTPVASVVGKIALPVFLFRFFVLRRVLEIFPLSFLVMAAARYAHFKNGADADPFALLPFAPYWALSLGVLAKTALGLARLFVTRLDVGVHKDLLPLGVFGSLAILPLVMIPDGVRSLDYARIPDGSFNDRDKVEACEWMAHRMAPATSVQIHASMHSTPAIDWALRRPTGGVDGPPVRPVRGNDRYFIADLAFMKPADQVRIASEFHMVALGQFVLIDRGAPYAPAEGYVFDSREPRPWEWYLRADTDPIRTVRRDPRYTWELRQQFGQNPNPAPPPDPAPTTPEELRIAHNVAVATGDATGAAEYEKRLVAQLDSSASAKFTDGTLLLGEQYVTGVAPVLCLDFLAAGPAATDAQQFQVQSVVQRPPRWSFVPADKSARAVGMPFAIPPKLWRVGFIYVDCTVIRHRPGPERFTGFFVGGKGAAPPKAVDGEREIPLLTLR